MEAPPLFRSLPYTQNASSSSSSYTPLPGQPEPVISPPAASGHDTRRKPPLGVFTVTALSAAFLVSFAVMMTLTLGPEPPPEAPGKDAAWPSRGAVQGVSEKAFRGIPGDGPSYNWTNAMLTWQRTAYHFQPQRNWMNDPNGPLYHLGWYHLFYQYNPDSAVWGNITWGHAVSRDLIHWLYLPLAMVPDHWFDINGVWSGSATLLPDGRIVMLYTGDTADYVQVQNLAYPADLSDPLLLHWVKYPNNPVMVPPPGIAFKDFRDPTTAWQGQDGFWRVTIGAKTGDTGISLVYKTTANFTAYELLDGVLHGVPGTGMWECIDFFPVSTWSQNGLDTSAGGPGVKHVLKASLDDNKRDYYAIGRYNPVEDKWTPDDPNQDVGIGLRVDYGRYYASKTFFDHSTRRRILWGWASETDSEFDDVTKGWASLQTIPRVVVFDNKTGSNLLQWPVEEVESLRMNSTEFVGVKVASGSVMPLQVGPAAQLDVVAEFEVDAEALETAAAAEVSDDVGYNCSVGAAVRGALGPFGVLVLATDTLSERTPVYFYIAKVKDGRLQPFFCVDQTRSSEANDVDHRALGSEITVLDGEKFSMRLLVDHSIVESFGQRGRSCITARVYPTQAILGAERLFLFNNATAANVTATVKVWQMTPAFLRPFPL